MKVIITGFEPLENWPSNASEILLRSLETRALDADESLGLEISYELIPARTGELRRIAAELMSRDAGAILLLGQAAQRNRLALERFALNWVEFAKPDASGAIASGAEIEPGAPHAFKSSLPELEEIAAELTAEGVPCYVSNHAGTSLCNQLLYLLLHLEHSRPRGAGSKTRIGFLHVPLLPEQVGGDWATCPCLPLEMERQASLRILRRLNIAPAENKRGSIK